MKRGILIIFIIFVISTVSAIHNVTTEYGTNLFTVNEDIVLIYKIKIDNTDTGQEANITQVNITLPENFIFISNSEGTNANYDEFSNTSNILNWVGLNLINSTEWKYFQFNAIAPTPGDYTITVKTLNKTGSYSKDISVTVYEIIDICAVNWSCTSWSECVNEKQIRNCIDLNSCQDNITETKNCSSQCIPKWNCVSWSECVNEKQIRSCIDFNLCEDNSTKPAEIKQCDSLCKSDWKCEEWQSEECEGNETQTRTCTDYNYCGTLQGKPSELKQCSKRNVNKLFIPAVVLIILMIITDLILMYEISKKRKSQSKKI